MEIEVKDKRVGCLTLAMWFFLVFCTGMILICLGSCRSVKYIPYETIKHDSILISKTDTVKLTHTIKEKEYVEVKDSASTTLDEQGNILKQEIWHNKTIIRQMSDSLEYYRAIYDSLRAVSQDTIRIPIPIERELSNAEKRYISLGKVSLGLYIGLALAFIAWLVYYIKRKKKMH
jgi:hypothetical protein